MISSARLQQEATVARAGLSSALNELRDSVATTALTNGAMTFAKEGSTAVARAAIDRAMASPLAAMLIGAGVVMLLAGKDTKIGEIADKGDAAIRSAAASVTGAGSGLAGAASSAFDATKNAATAALGTAGAATDRVKEAASSASMTATDAFDKAKELAATGQEQGQQHALEQAQQLIADSKSKLERFAQEQPILVAALGVAFGAALGASLPMTKAETEFLGDKAKKAASQGVEIGKQVADAVTGKLAGQDVGGKVGEVVAAVTQTVTAGVTGKSA
jgi:hypothetical protein